MTTKQKYDYKYLQQFCLQNSITLLNDYSQEKITRDIQINGKCKTELCSDSFCKSFRDLINYDAYCKQCAKQNRVNIRMQYENNIFEKKFTYEYLQEYCKENNITLLNNYSNYIDLKRETIIDGQCIVSDCENNFRKNFRRLTETGGYCVECTNNNRIKKINNTIINNHKNISHEKSLSSHPNSKFFSIKNKDDDGNIISTDNIYLGTHDKYWFDCLNCGHDFEISINKIHNWCPYCRDTDNKFCDNEECKICYKNSISSVIDNIKNYQIINFTNKIYKVTKKSSKEILIKCNVCKHTFTQRAYSITNGNGCKYCTKNSRILCSVVECNHCYNKSFASSLKSNYLNEPNINPRHIFKSSNIKCSFICEFNHSFEATLNNISFNKWCPFCINKTEQKLFEQLSPSYASLEQQFKVEWCKNINYLPFDFVLEEYKLIIELDGPQHFKQISNWKSPEETYDRDKYKEKCANDNGYSVIRLLQEDVFYDTYDWVNELITNIEKIKIESIIQNIYLCKNNEYNTFI